MKTYRVFLVLELLASGKGIASTYIKIKDAIS